MASSRMPAAPKRDLEKYSEYDPSASDSASIASSSSASFQMEMPSSDEDEEMGQTGGVNQNSFQVKLMDSQETHMSFTPNLGTQPPPRATPRRNKKRKVSLSPRDSLAKATNSPEMLVVIDTDTDTAEQSPGVSIRKASPTVKKMTKSQKKKSPSPKRAVQTSDTTKKSDKTTLAKIDSSPSKEYSKVKDLTTITAVATKKSQSPGPTKKQPKTTEAKSAQPKLPSATTNAPNKANSAGAIANSPPSQKATKPIKQSASDPTEKAPSITAKNGVRDVGAASSTKKTDSKSNAKAVATAVASGAEKSKKKKPKKKTFQDQLLHHMFFNCKPFTMKTLTQELEASEASVNFCLMSLTDKGWVVRKEFTSKNRSKELFWANQEAKSKELSNALRIVPPEQVAAARRELGNLQEQEKYANQQLHQVLQEPSNEALNNQLLIAEQEVSELEGAVKAALDRIRSAQEPKPQPKQRVGFGKTKAIKAKPTCPKRLKVRINKMRDEWRKRKEKCDDFVEQLADGMEKKVKDVVKMLELETDEVVRVKMPPKYVIDKR